MFYYNYIPTIPIPLQLSVSHAHIIPLTIPFWNWKVDVISRFFKKRHFVELDEDLSHCVKMDFYPEKM